MANAAGYQISDKASRGLADLHVAIFHKLAARINAPVGSFVTDKHVLHSLASYIEDEDLFTEIVKKATNQMRQLQTRRSKEMSDTQKEKLRDRLMQARIQSNDSTISRLTAQNAAIDAACRKRATASLDSDTM